MTEDSHSNRTLGMTRRDLVRRGAIVGGTLLWTVPVVASLSSAQLRAAHSPATGCCECFKPKSTGQAAYYNPQCPEVPIPPNPGTPQSQSDSPDQCAHACKRAGYSGSRFFTVPGHVSFPCVPGVGCVQKEPPPPSPKPPRSAAP
jgi:hypothetical protein